MKTLNHVLKLFLFMFLIGCGPQVPEVPGEDDIPEVPGEGNPGDGDNENPGDGDNEEPGEDFVLMDPSIDGDFEVSFYERGLTSSSYASARIFYPEATSDNPGPYPVTSTSGGYTESKESMYWFAQRLASHGFIVIAFTPNNQFSFDPREWSNGHVGSLETVLRENDRRGSPINGKVNEDKLAVSGFSLGGAGSILAANQLGDRLSVVAAFNAYNPTRPTTKAATLFLSGANDTVARPANIKSSYDSLRGAPKAYLNFSGFGHSMTRPGRYSARISRYVVSWYQYHMYGNPLYLDFLNGDNNQNDLSSGVFARGGYEIELTP